MYFQKIFLISALAAISANPVHAGGGFSGSCKNWYVSGYTLHANCGDGHGGYRDTSKDLNQCIANYGGNLACATNGGFGGSCSGCEVVTGTYMKCHCGPGPNNTPTIDLNACIANYGGNLACAK
ncbi:hypothetical protein FRC08_011189 [Ceratobasidium sp. 394]|nr:hypothetical protein FRC08_011189 [Ceratobasidium sp. 394]KAG9084309.1 hypothetical protein FS749_005322 [Ceratobasidium sp. UAMH 11750]